ncbi:MAG: hypothetical protein ACO2O4_04175 [Minisyncoccia bacterium]|jgi:hypothetical protein
MAKKLDSALVRMYRLLRKIEELKAKYEEMKESIMDELRNQPNQEYITTDPKTGTRIEAKLITRETWEIPVAGFIEKFRERIDVNNFLKVDGNKVKRATEEHGIFEIEELKEIGLVTKTTEYISIREVKRK